MAIDQEFLKSIGLDDDAIVSKLVAKSAEDEAGLVNKRDELLGKVTSYKDQLRQFEGVDVSEYAKLKAKMAEFDEKNMMDKGEFDQLLKKKEEEWSGKYMSLGDKYASLRNTHLEEIEDKAILTAVGDKGDGETILDVIKRRGWIKSVDTDSGIVLNIKSMDGTTELKSVSELIEQMSKSDKYARLFNSSGLSGADARQSGKGASVEVSKLFGAKKIAAAREK